MANAPEKSEREKNESIKEMGTVKTKNKRGNIHCLNRRAYGIAAAEQNHQI